MKNHSSNSEMEVSADMDRCLTESEDNTYSADQTFVLLPGNMAGSHATLPDRFSNDLKQRNVNFATKNPLFFKEGRLRPLPTKWGYVQSGNQQLVCIDLESQDIVDSRILQQYFAKQDEVIRQPIGQRPMGNLGGAMDERVGSAKKTNGEENHSVSDSEGKFKPSNLKLAYRRDLKVEIDNSDSNKKDTTRKSVNFLPTNETSNRELFSRRTVREDGEVNFQKTLDHQNIAQPRTSANHRRSTNFWTPKNISCRPIAFNTVEEKLSFTMVPLTQMPTSRGDFSPRADTNMNEGVLNLLVEKIDSIKDKLTHLERNWIMATNSANDRKTIITDHIDRQIGTFNQFETEEGLRHSRYVFHDQQEPAHQQTHLIDEDGYYTSNILRRSSSGMIAEGIHLQSHPHLQSSIKLSNGYFQDSVNHMGMFQGNLEQGYESNGHDIIYKAEPDMSAHKAGPQASSKLTLRPSVSIEQFDHDYLSVDQDHALNVSPRNQRRGSQFGNTQTTPNRRSTNGRVQNSDNIKGFNSSLHRSPQFAPFNEPSNFYNQELKETMDDEYFGKQGRFTISERNFPLQRASLNVRQSGRTLNSQHRQTQVNRDELLSRSNFKRPSHNHPVRDSVQQNLNAIFEFTLPNGNPTERIRYYYKVLAKEKEALQGLQQRIGEVQNSIRAKTIQKRNFKRDVFSAYIGETQDAVKPTSVLKGLEKIYSSIKNDLREEKKGVLNLHHLLRAKALLLEMIEKRLNEVSQSPETELCDLIRRSRDIVCI
jgi:hypothetical protein